MFPPNTYQNRRQGLIDQLESGLVLLLGNERSSINYPDQHYPFRQDSSFLYYFGLDRPGLVGLIDLEAGESLVFGNEYTLDHLVWMGPQTTLSELAERSGLGRPMPTDQLPARLARAQQQGRAIHFLPPYLPANQLKLQQWLALDPKEKHSEALVHAVVQQRSYKNDEEIAEMTLAVDLSGRMHRHGMAGTYAGRKESEVMAMVYAEAHAANSRPAYGVICSVHGEVLHNETYLNPLEEGQLLLLDAGGESPLHYAGDITRTWPVNGTFTQQQREIYAIVLGALEEAEAGLKPGVPYRELHLRAAKHLFEGLKGLGLTHGDSTEAVAAGAHALFFPHGLGHMIGLDVHDMEDLGEDHVGYTPELRRSQQFGLRNLRLARPLETGFTLTVEPGLYFIPGLIDRWEQEGKHQDFIHYDKLKPYRNFGGIRLEDDYLITEDGAKRLGDPIPRTVAEVEEMLTQK